MMQLQIKSSHTVIRNFCLKITADVSYCTWKTVAKVCQPGQAKPGSKCDKIAVNVQHRKEKRYWCILLRDADKVLVSLKQSSYTAGVCCPSCPAKCFVTCPRKLFGKGRALKKILITSTNHSCSRRALPADMVVVKLLLKAAKRRAKSSFSAFLCFSFSDTNSLPLQFSSEHSLLFLVIKSEQNTLMPEVFHRSGYSWLTLLCFGHMCIVQQDGYVISRYLANSDAILFFSTSFLTTSYIQFMLPASAQP